MPTPIQLPEIAEAERTPLVEQVLGLIAALVEANQRQAERLQQLRDEIAVLKGEKAKPAFKPSGMDTQTEAETGGGESGESKARRAGSSKRRKTQALIIHEDCPIAPSEPLPANARFKGDRAVIVQDLRIQAHNTRDRLEVWLTPEGDWLCGHLPPRVQGRHFGPGLRADVLDQHHQCHVTQPWLREQLLEWGIEVSVGQIDAPLSGHNEAFFGEKDPLLNVGLEVSSFITVDDAGARHQGCNGYVTQMGNDFFAWFSSTERKSRINFLQLLQAGDPLYSVTDEALGYWRDQGLPQALCQALMASPMLEWATPPTWEAHLQTLGITQERHQRLATEGALLGGLLARGLSRELVIVSDGAGQFAILLLKTHQGELLLVLLRPDIPLHTNGSENDIRGDVKWRKISGGTRSDLGRRCRDTFASLKKTCRKLGISFWEYLNDRIGQVGAIAPLPQIVRERALAAAGVP